MKELNQSDKDYLLDNIRDIKDFPKPGIVFKDITTLLNDAKAFEFLMFHLEKRYKEYNLEYIAGIDSRGFIFGAALATRLGIAFVPIRKKGKLPSTVISEKYSLEYGFDEVQIHIDAFHEKKGAKVLLIDDLIATGGTAQAAVKLIEDTGATCVEACFIIGLSALAGIKNLSKEIECYCVLEIKE